MREDSQGLGSEPATRRTRIVREAICYGAALLGLGVALGSFGAKWPTQSCFGPTCEPNQLLLSRLLMPALVLVLALLWHSSLAERLSPRLHLYGLATMVASAAGSVIHVLTVGVNSYVSLPLPGNAWVEAETLTNLAALFAALALVAGAVWSKRPRPASSEQ